MKRIRELGFYFLAAAVVLVEVVAVLGLIPSQWRELTALRANKMEKSQKVRELETGLSVLTTVDQRELVKQLAVVNAALPSNKKTSGLVSGIIRIASASGVALSSLEFSPGNVSTVSAEAVEDEAVLGTKVRQMAATVTIGSDVLGLTTFLSKIASASQLIDTKEVSYSNNASRVRSAQITLQVYFQPESTELVKWGEIRPVSASESAILRALSSKDVFTVPQEQH